MRRSTSPSLTRPSSSSSPYTTHRVRHTNTTSSGPATTTVNQSTETARETNEYKSLERERRVVRDVDGGRRQSHDDDVTSTTAPVVDTSTSSSSSSPPPLGGGSVRLPTRTLLDTTPSSRNHHPTSSSSTPNPRQQHDEGRKLSSSPSPPISNTSWKSSREAVTTSVSHGRLLSLRYYLRWYSWWWLRSQCRVEKKHVDDSARNYNNSVYPIPPPLSGERHRSSSSPSTSDTPPAGNVRQSTSPTSSSTPDHNDDVGRRSPLSQSQQGTRGSSHSSKRSKHRDDLLREMMGIVDVLLPDRGQEDGNRGVELGDDSSPKSGDVQSQNNRDGDATRARAEATVEELLTRRREQRMRMHLSTEDTCCANPPKAPFHHDRQHQDKVSSHRRQPSSSRLLRRDPTHQQTPSSSPSGGRRASSSSKADVRRKGPGGYFFDVPQPSPLFTLHYLPSTPTPTSSTPPTIPPPEPFKVTVPRGPDLRVDRRAESRPRHNTYTHTTGGVHRPASAPSRRRRDPSPASQAPPPRQAPIITTEASWLKHQSHKSASIITPRTSTSKANDDGAFERYVLVDRIQPGVRAYPSSPSTVGGGSDKANYDRVYHHRAELRDVLAGAYNNNNEDATKGEYVYTTTTCIVPTQKTSPPPPPPVTSPIHHTHSASEFHNVTSNEVAAVASSPPPPAQHQNTISGQQATANEDNMKATTNNNNVTEFVVRWDDDNGMCVNNEHSRKRGGVSGVVEDVPTASRVSSTTMKPTSTSRASKSKIHSSSSPTVNAPTPSLSLSPEEITAMKAALKVLVKEAREERRRKEGAAPRDSTLMNTHAHQRDHVRTSSATRTYHHHHYDGQRNTRGSSSTKQTAKPVSAVLHEDPYLKDVHRSERAMKRAVKDLLWRQAPERRLKEEWGQYIGRVIPSAADAVGVHHRAASKALQQRSTPKE